MADARMPRLLPMSMAMIVVVIVAKAGVLLNAFITDSTTATRLLSQAHAATDHLQETPKPVPLAAKSAQAPAGEHAGSAPTRAQTSTLLPSAAATQPETPQKADADSMSDSEKA